MKIVRSTRPGSSEQGMALAIAIMLLLILSTIVAVLLTMSTTETSISANFRDEQTAFFAARGGIEEVRDRLASGATDSLSAIIPAALPGTANGILYVTNAASGETVAPWNTSGSDYPDTQICKEVACSGGVPSGSPWYTHPTAAVASTTYAATPQLTWKWVRVMPKINKSMTGPSPVTSVDGTTSGSNICWNTTNELVSTVAGAACQKGTTQVYEVTALAMTPSGSRRMVQMEVAAPFPPLSGFNATSTACPAITLSGGSTTNSFSSASGGTYATTVQQTGGTLGTNGSVSLSGGGTQVGGSITAGDGLTGSCPHGLNASGGSGMVAGQTPANALLAATQGINVADPVIPAPGTTNETLPASASLSPGNYKDITVSGGATLTLSPGTYNINSITLSGNSKVTINPAGQVILNVTGTGKSTPIDFSGGSISNTTGIAANFQINYDGTGQVNLSGGSDNYAVVNAPHAPVVFSGGSNFYGSLVASTINDSGGTDLHFDRALSQPPNAIYKLVVFRELLY